jgi:hypothetical protein
MRPLLNTPTIVKYDLIRDAQPVLCEGSTEAIVQRGNAHIPTTEADSQIVRGKFPSHFANLGVSLRAVVDHTRIAEFALDDFSHGDYVAPLFHFDMSLSHFLSSSVNSNGFDGGSEITVNPAATGS